MPACSLGCSAILSGAEAALQSSLPLLRQLALSPLHDTCLEQCQRLSPFIQTAEDAALQLNGNPFTGCLPSTWPAQLPNVTTLRVENDNLSGNIPSDYDNWNSLTTMCAPCGVLASVSCVLLCCLLCEP